MDFQNNFKIMKIKKSLIVLSIFISYSLTGQEENLMNIFTNDASIGINMSIVSDISNNNTDKLTFFNYTKHINHVIAFQFEGIFGNMRNSYFGDGLSGVSANGIINLSNLTYGKSSKSLLYLSSGAYLIDTKTEGKEAIANIGGGIKFNINDQYQRIDIDISTKLGINPFKYETTIYPICGVGISYRFNSLKESVEWNNPLHIIYKDLKDLKSKIDSSDEAKIKDNIAKIRSQDAKISSNSNNIKNVYSIAKNNISQIEQLNTEINKLKNKDDYREFISSVTINEITLGYHIISGSYASFENAKRKLKQVQRDGFASSNIQEGANGLFRVFLESYKNKDEALIKLNKLKASGKSVWLLE